MATSLVPRSLFRILHLFTTSPSTLASQSFNPFKFSAARAMSSESTQRLFQLKFDPLTGNSEWVVIEEEAGGVSEDSQKPLLATTSYLDMLNDSTRNKAFREAIDKTISKPCRVLDIGYFFSPVLSLRCFENVEEKMMILLELLFYALVCLCVFSVDQTLFYLL